MIVDAAVNARQGQGSSAPAMSSASTQLAYLQVVWWSSVGVDELRNSLAKLRNDPDA